MEEEEANEDGEAADVDEAEGGVVGTLTVVRLRLPALQSLATSASSFGKPEVALGPSTVALITKRPRELRYPSFARCRATKTAPSMEKHPTPAMRI